MFTGIVEEVGRISRIAQKGKNRRITIEAKDVPGQLATGQSVSVSGVCLTALDIKPASFCADLAPETWERTSFSRIHEGALVNLELPMKADARFGGHIVQGHVDGVGRHTRTMSERVVVARFDELGQAADDFETGRLTRVESRPRLRPPLGAARPIPPAQRRLAEGRGGARWLDTRECGHDLVKMRHTPGWSRSRFAAPPPRCAAGPPGAIVPGVPRPVAIPLRHGALRHD